MGNWPYLSLHHGWEGDGYRIELRWKGQVSYGEDQRGFLFNAGCENTATTFCNWTSTASTGASLLGTAVVPEVFYVPPGDHDSAAQNEALRSFPWVWFERLNVQHAVSV